MSSIIWSESNLPTLGRVFLRNMLDNMRKYEGSTVRLGETGEGVQPNYQVTFPNGVCRTIRGSSHEAFDQAEEFDSNKISEPFSRAQVEAAYKQV